MQSRYVNGIYKLVFAFILYNYIGTHDLQGMSISKEGKLLTLSCHFARGATSHECTLLLDSTSNSVSMQRNLTLPNDANCTTATQCSVHTTIDLSTLFTNDGNTTVLITAFDSFNRSLDVQEIIVEVFHSRMNTIPSPNSTIAEASSQFESGIGASIITIFSISDNYY